MLLLLHPSYHIILLILYRTGICWFSMSSNDVLSPLPMSTIDVSQCNIAHGARHLLLHSLPPWGMASHGMIRRNSTLFRFFTFLWNFVFISCISRLLPQPLWFFLLKSCVILLRAFLGNLLLTMWDDLWYHNFCQDCLALIIINHQIRPSSVL